MFGKNTSDVSKTLSLMIDKAMVDCRSNQTAAVQQVADWIKQDRRFDSLNASALAKEAFDSKRCGKTLDLTKPYRTDFRRRHVSPLKWRTKMASGESTKENLSYWSKRAEKNSEIAPRASSEMKLPSTGKQIELRDTSMAPKVSRSVDAKMKDG